MLGGFALAYGAVLSAGAVQVAGPQRRWDLVWPVMAAFVIVHLSWSSGFVTSLVSFGRWPRWPGQGQALAKGGQRGFSGVRLLQALAGVLVLTVVVPPGLATLINWSRVERAQEEIFRLVDVLQDVGLVDRASSQEREDLLGGPGVAPGAPGAREWADGHVASLSGYVSQPLESDPWGSRYLVNIGVLRISDAAEASTVKHALWVLSAGPNGVVETPFVAPAASAVVGGDDIAARIAQ